MKKDKQIKELYEMGVIQKCKHFYYQPMDNIPSLNDILKVNEITMAFSEWWEVYHARVCILKENAITNGIPIISYEDCVSMGL